MLLRRWDYGHKEYIDYKTPSDLAVKIYAGIDEECNCASCGARMLFGDGYTSKEIHNRSGIGFCICPHCYEQESVREDMHRRKS